MSKAAGFAIGLFTMIVPVLAMACPGARGTACCGSAFGEYASQFGIGLLAGVGSVAIESALRKRKRS
jgi:hypothetical protein